jgi:hypothetical protein
LASDPQTGWGASLRLVADFKARPALVSSARQLIAELCSAYLEPSDQAAALVMAAQELLENLAKYSTDDHTCFEFALGLKEGRPEVAMGTSNAATTEHLAEASSLLGRIADAAEPVALYDEWVAASGEREGSRLGLIRLRAEAGLTLTHEIEQGRLALFVRAAVEPKRSSS